MGVMGAPCYVVRQAAFDLRIFYRWQDIDKPIFLYICLLKFFPSKFLYLLYEVIKEFLYGTLSVCLSVSLSIPNLQNTKEILGFLLFVFWAY